MEKTLLINHLFWSVFLVILFAVSLTIMWKSVGGSNGEKNKNPNGTGTKDPESERLVSEKTTELSGTGEKPVQVTQTKKYDNTIYIDSKWLVGMGAVLLILGMWLLFIHYQVVPGSGFQALRNFHFFEERQPTAPNSTNQSVGAPSSTATNASVPPEKPATNANPIVRHVPPRTNEVDPTWIAAPAVENLAPPPRSRGLRTVSRPPAHYVPQGTNREIYIGSRGEIGPIDRGIPVTFHMTLILLEPNISEAKAANLLAMGQSMLKLFSKSRRNELTLLTNPQSESDKVALETLVREYFTEKWQTWLDTYEILIAEAHFTTP